MIDDSTEHLLRFRRFRDLYGNPVSATIGRRNHKATVFLQPPFEGLPPALDADDIVDQKKLFVNLNPLECATWTKILRAQSLASIAKEEGVSRAAIYSRIQGNRKGQGGMIGKNFWALLWWRLRQKTQGNHL